MNWGETYPLGRNISLIQKCNAMKCCDSIKFPKIPSDDFINREWDIIIGNVVHVHAFGIFSWKCKYNLCLHFGDPEILILGAISNKVGSVSVLIF